jgi:hypothetical protein
MGNTRPAERSAILRVFNAPLLGGCLCWATRETLEIQRSLPEQRARCRRFATEMPRYRPYLVAREPSGATETC